MEAYLEGHAAPSFRKGATLGRRPVGVDGEWNDLALKEKYRLDPKSTHEDKHHNNDLLHPPTGPQEARSQWIPNSGVPVDQTQTQGYRPSRHVPGTGHFWNETGEEEEDQEFVQEWYATNWA